MNKRTWVDENRELAQRSLKRIIALAEEEMHHTDREPEPPGLKMVESILGLLSSRRLAEIRLREIEDKGAEWQDEVVSLRRQLGSLQRKKDEAIESLEDIARLGAVLSPAYKIAARAIERDKER